jgi:DNA-binding transcriptional regulator YhcF (GntR family)
MFMRLILDHRSPVPLYHQLAEAIRYRIATGDLKSGTTLPPLRRAAELWGISLHTIRQAYAELARAGIVVTSVPGGTRVLPSAAEKPVRHGPAAHGQFLESIVSVAKFEHGLSVDELIRLLRGVKSPPSRVRVSVLECSQSQSEDLAGQIEARFRVTVAPIVLDRTYALPDGLVVGTYFHYNDIRVRWPERLSDVRFLPISPEPDLGGRLRLGRRRNGRRLPVTFCEREEAMARNISADLVRILPAKQFRIITKVVRKAQDGLQGEGPHTPVLFSPRLWGELPAALRQDPRVYQVRYTFSESDLDAFGVDQGWEPR